MTEIDVTKLQGEAVLVMGATGFLGSQLVQRLGRLGAHVVGASRGADPRRPAQPNVTWRQSDASDASHVAKMFKDVRPSIVYHLTSDSQGGRDLDLVASSVRNDFLATVNVLVEAANSGIKRLVMTGSCEEPTGEAGEAIPGSPYAAAKWASCGYARMISALHGLPVAVLRLMMAYGPGQKNYKVIPYTILSLLRGETAKLSSAKRAIDLVYVDDVVDALVRAAVAPRLDAQSIDIGSGRLVRLSDCLWLIGGLLQRPDLLDFGAIKDRAMEREYAASTSEAARWLSWRAHTDLNDGLRQTIEWYRAREQAST
jgi:nucleoside-diphosphate-sugar epimerase